MSTDLTSALSPPGPRGPPDQMYHGGRQMYHGGPLTIEESITNDTEVASAAIQAMDQRVSLPSFYSFGYLGIYVNCPWHVPCLYN
ncbi:hypothetical protein L1987_31968 [Smallanthus sonchifolius]|uniref:Uncharacterized protein n=1 Tax=Smallanthus sonchifolius TaxID=185202 RepID=A0ACB9I8G7_9ASTR|nr:hypothetical protein L1987_31968 [Smallanthus sonchifolius]